MKKVILLLSVVFGIVLGTVEVEAAGTVIYNGEVSYGLTTVGDFTVNGNTAFCIEHEKPTPPTGTALTEQVYEDADIRKVLYYGWNGPAQWNGFENSSHGIVATSIVLSYYYTGSRVSTESQSFYNWLRTQPPAPDNTIALSKSYTEAYLSEDKSYQRTENITLTADKSNYITMSLPAGVKLCNITRNATTEGSAVIYGGDTFYLSAPLELDGEWASGIMQGIIKNYQPIVCMTSEDVQNLGYGTWVEDEISTVQLQVKWIPHGKIRLQKVDAETGENQAQGDGSLEHAVYEIYNTVGTFKEALSTDEKGSTWSGLLPYDTYIIKEVTASRGYLIQPEPLECVLDAEEAEAVSEEQIIRAGIKGVKIGGGSHKRLAGVPFEIVSRTTGEKHTVVTDVNGEFNAKDIWFGAGMAEEAKEALLYDTYTITELSCEANEGYELIPPFDVTVYEDGQVIELGTLTDKKWEQPEEPPEPPKEQPEEPAEPETVQRTVKTGDSQNLIVLILLLILSCATAVFCGKIFSKLPYGKRKK